MIASMHNALTKQPAAPAAQPAYRELTALDAIIEAAIVREPAEPSMLDALAAEPVPTYSRGRKLTVRYEGATRQDTDVQSVGGLFGAVEESDAPTVRLHASQYSLPMGAVEVDRGEGCCICGDKGCGIGPFVRTGGSR